MIAQIWRGRPRAEDRPDFTSLLRAQIQAARFLRSCDRAPQRGEVIIDPRRALLYANLRRRFPSRIVALR
jgi:hypothetical protein